MNLQEILRALQAGEINPEEAKKQLEEINTGPVQSSRPYTRRSSEQPFNCSPGQRMENPGKIGTETTAPSAVDFREVEPGIVQLTMQDRVHKNSFSEDLIRGLIQSFDLIRANSNYKVVILTGYDNYFSSGGTQDGLLAICDGKMKYTDSNVYRLALDCKIPVIAAMQGHGIGAGWCLGMSCDFIVMSRESYYTTNFMKFGFTPGFGSTLYFPEKFENGLAREILFTGKKYRGAELESRGVSSPILPQKEVLPYAIKLAKELSESPRESLITLKDHMTESIRRNLSSTIEKEIAMHDKTFVHQPEVRERIQSFFGQFSNNDDNNKEKKIHKEIVHKEKEIQNHITSSIPSVDSNKEAVPTGNFEGDKSSYVNISISSKSANKSIPIPQDQNAIAIIGRSGRFPKSKTLPEFWDNLAHGRDCISEVPSARWSVGEHCDPDPKAPGKSYSKWMGVLEDADKFDPLFFNMSPTEAEFVDPQQRLFLESCWHCIEDAGLSPSSLSGSRCGVFVGCASGDYAQLVSKQGLSAQALMGGAPSILSSRISYLLNLKGPCLAIDTACSSSLVAIAEACNSLILRTSDLALAGGVNIMAGPSMHIMTSKAAMLSPQGRCFTFDARANGFVPAEGVGVILLKRLSDAIRDKDPIYGVIRGWGINQDGKTNGITAPSVNSQILLEKEVYERFGINPETISLVEAHGTGTILGDPIEVEALVGSFRSYTAKKNYCALGAVKSNIGHLLCAAGVAGVVKVLLALEHRMLPPTIHFEKLNEHISLDNSPFYINTKLQSWDVSAGNPRRASVSSFGFSGTNAHIVIEEYAPRRDSCKPPVPINSNHPILFVLSAKSEERLKKYAEEMKVFIESHEDLDLTDMAYTLQVGRDAMDYRLAFLADSRETLLKRLAGFIENNLSAGVLTAAVKKSKDAVAVFVSDNDAKVLLQTWIQKRKLKQIGELWVKGLPVDWNDLYGAARPGRISLPAYPFLMERYWISDSVQDYGEAKRIHPLVDRVNLDLSLHHSGVVFQKKLRTADLMVQSHTVNDELILPEMMQLEMARAAASRIKDGPVIQLSNVVWVRPLAVQADATEVRIAVKEESKRLRYEIQSDDDHGDAIIHSHGEFSLNGKVSEAIGQRLSIEDIKTRCSHQIAREELYAQFERSGIHYGPYFQGLSRIWGNTEEALGLLNLDPAQVKELKQYVLHPTVMEGVFQTIAYLSISNNDAEGGQALQLLSAEKVEIFRPLQARGYVYADSAGQSRFHAAIVDETGQVCVKLSHVLLGIVNDPLQNFFYAPVWHERSLSGDERALRTREESGMVKRRVLIIHPFRSLGLERALTEAHSGDEVITIKLGSQTVLHSGSDWEIRTEDPLALDGCIEKLGNIQTVYYLGGIQSEERGNGNLEVLELSQERGVLSLFRLIKSLSSRGFIPKPLRLKVITNDVYQIRSGEQVRPYAASLIGLTKTMAKEYLDWQISCIDINGDTIDEEGSKEELHAVVNSILDEPGHPRGDEVAFRDGKRYIRVIEPVLLPPLDQSPFKREGVYLILGGAGGIGLELSLYLAEKVRARLVLIGRSALNSEKEEKIARIHSRGGKVLYLQADAADLDSMSAAIDKARSHFGAINGAIHSAVVLKDKIIRNMDESTFCSALDPKVKGSVVLHKALEGEKLDFMLFFSSVNSFEGNPGQSNYAAGCTFEDAFAHYLGQREAYPVKIINWGYWGTVGVASNKEYNKRMAAQGLLSIGPEEGMEAVRRILSQPKSQIIPIKVAQNLLERRGARFNSQVERPSTEGRVISKWLSAVDTNRLVREVISEGLKIPIEKIDDETSFENFGVDSLMAVLLVKSLEERFEIKLDPSIFMQYPTVKSLSDYLNRSVVSGPKAKAQPDDSVQERSCEIRDTADEREEEPDSQCSDVSMQSLVKPTGSGVDAVVSIPDNSVMAGFGKRDGFMSKIEGVEQYFSKLSLFWAHTILVFFQEQNMFNGQKPISKNHIISKIGFIPQYEYVVEVFLDVLEKSGLVVIDRDSVCLTDNALSSEVQTSLNMLHSRQELLMRAVPDLNPHLLLFQFCKNHYQEIVTGRIKAEVLLLSDQALPLMEYVYKGDHRLSFGINAVILEYLDRYIENNLYGKQERVRVLEMGAGTLSAGGSIVDYLKEKIQRIDYYYTDKPHVFRRMKQDVGQQAYSCVTFHEIDEQDVGKREAVERFDIIILRTAVTALQPLTRAIERIDGALKNEGLIVIGEPLEADYLSLTLGLLDKAWTYQSSFPAAVRPSAESKGSWQQVLTRAGFSSEEALGRRLVIASRDARAFRKGSHPASDQQGKEEDSLVTLPGNSAAPMPRGPSEPLQEEKLLKREVFTTSSDHQIEYFTCGQGDPIVFLTALAFTYPIWKNQIEKFQNQYQLIFPHILPGHAGSVFAGKSFTFEELADDLAELLDHLELSAVHLLGWCMAGNIAQLFALRHCDRLKTLTLVCTTPTDARLRGIATQDLKSYSVDPLGTYELEFQNIYQQRFYRDKSIRDYLDLIRKSSCKVQEEAVMHHIYNLFEFDTRKRLKDILIPTMVMSGKWDIGFPPDQVKLLHQGIKHSKFIEFEMAGHLPFLNQHDLFNNELEVFLRTNREKASQGYKGQPF